MYNDNYVEELKADFDKMGDGYLLDLLINWSFNAGRERYHNNIRDTNKIIMALREEVKRRMRERDAALHENSAK